MANLDKYADIHGPVFNVKTVDDDRNPRRYFTLKTYSKGTFVSCTLWDSSHKHIEIKDGDIVSVSGKLTATEKDGKVYRNVSVFRIHVSPMDEGTREPRDDSSDGVADEEDAL